MKRTKNSRKMHMVFNVQSGTVEVKVHENEFTVHKCGIWQVPRGEFFCFLSSSPRYFPSPSGDHSPHCTSAPYPDVLVFNFRLPRLSSSLHDGHHLSLNIVGLPHVSLPVCRIVQIICCTAWDQGKRDEHFPSPAYCGVDTYACCVTSEAVRFPPSRRCTAVVRGFQRPARRLRRTNLLFPSILISPSPHAASFTCLWHGRRLVAILVIFLRSLARLPLGYHSALMFSMQAIHTALGTSAAERHASSLRRRGR